uniref:Essential protein Yae1 N-terminal domain-containing protein n=1 Tax=Aureoumbra lagunensis TaxID=44058 RepID=A0A7S3JWQ7_9STRA|mmetsp:Transcript_15851/g.19301  ORF Transcript_15851/g.19301 Transcript_15851/m.19301 type:complete len:139 (+) Transcript_15851:93-509(+)
MANDFLDDCLKIEECSYADGHVTGFTDGLQEGEKEGYEVGKAKAIEIGAELGYYRGCCTVLRPHISEKAKNSMIALEKLIDSMLNNYNTIDLPRIRQLFTSTLIQGGLQKRQFSFSSLEEDNGDNESLFLHNATKLDF